ncbi:MAG: Rab family GTPase [Promethearchaeota archaeon]
MSQKSILNKVKLTSGFELPYHLKIINAGDGGVGKTTFLKRYTTGKFVVETKETIGTGFFTKKIKNKVINDFVDLTIWDLGGQQRFRNIVKDFVMGAAGALLFFDLTRYKTFQSLEEWISIIRTFDEDDKNIPILLVGAKSDLSDAFAIEKKEIDKLVIDKNMIGYIQTSSKTGENVEKAIEILVDYIFKTGKEI